jgi:hypothetical protein
MVMAEESGSSLMQLAVVAGVAWVGYEYWWKPKQIEDEYNRQIAAYQATHGVSRGDAIAQIGNIACIGAAAYFGTPATAALLSASGTCQVVGALTSSLVKLGIPAGENLFRGTKYVAQGTYGVGKEVVSTVVSVPKKIISGLASGLRSIF